MIKNYFQLVRIPQWIKNFFVFVPLIFSKKLFEVESVYTASIGFIIFCLISSIIYIINDIIDIEADKLHPKKKNRPLPSGKMTIPHALAIMFILVITVGILIPKGNWLFIAIIISYLILNIFYSFSFKHIVLLDIFSIAAGFMLRVISGAAILNVYISSWLILTTMFISLFLAVMKRYSELETVNGSAKGTRKVLAFYSQSFTQQMATIAAAAVIICYALYTVAERTVNVFHTENLIYTTPFVVFGIFRYMYLTYMDKNGENMTEIMLTDKPMIINVILYIICTVFIIYNGSAI